MTDVTSILSKIESGDPSAAAELLPLVYNELRKLAAVRLAQEKPGQTLQATALVHEAWMRLVGNGRGEESWDSRGHFFAAAAESMRRILVENARRKQAIKRGGGRDPIALHDAVLVSASSPVDILALDEALEKLAEHDPRKAELVKLRFFAGLTIQQAARSLGISESTADVDWAYAKAWLRVRLTGS